MLIVKTFLIYCCIVFSVSFAFAQEQDSVSSSWRHGIGGGFTFYTNVVSFKGIPSVPSCCPGFENTSSTAVPLWFSSEYQLLQPLWLQLRAGVEFGTISFSADEIIGSALLNGQPTDAISRHTLSTSLTTFSLEPTVIYQPISSLPVEIVAGASIQFLAKGTFSQQEQLLAPFGATYGDGKLTRNQAEGTLSEIATTPILNGIIGLRGRIPIGKEFSLAPELQYRPAIGNILQNVEWQRHALRAGLSVLWSPLPSTPEPEKPAKEQRPQPEERKPVIADRPKRPASTAIVSMEFTDPSGNSLRKLIVQESQLESKRFPLLPYVFFPQGNADLRQTRMRLLNKQQTQTFTEDTLQNFSLDVYKDLLNIVGSRMLSNPVARLTLLGSVNNVQEEAGNRDLAFSRAQAVKEYLVNNFGIGTERIETIATLLPRRPSNNERPEGQEENRRVELSSDDPDLLRDVVILATKQQLIPDSLYAEIPEALQGSQARLISFSGSTALADTIITLPKRIAVPIKNNGRFEGVFSAEIRPLDSLLPLGRNSLPVESNRKTLTPSQYEVFIIFDYGSTNITSQVAASLAELAQRVDEQANISITGFTDKTGDELFNRKLSEQRCQSVQKSLVQNGIDASRISISPTGGVSSLYDNTLPEGRFYSRNVTLTITP